MGEEEAGEEEAGEEEVDGDGRTDDEEGGDGDARDGNDAALPIAGRALPGGAVGVSVYMPASGGRGGYTAGVWKGVY